MTFAEVIQRVRHVVSDDDPSKQTWVDDKYIEAGNDGLAVIFHECPDSRLSTTGTLNSLVDVTSVTVGSEMNLPEAYFTALVEYMVYRYYTVDSRNTRDATRGKEHFARFQELIYGRR